MQWKYTVIINQFKTYNKLYTCALSCILCTMSTKNNAQTIAYMCITYLHAYVCVCPSAYVFQLQNHLTDFDLITHQRYATEGHC